LKVLLYDNYDSFTYNLVHYLEDLDCEVVVIRNTTKIIDSSFDAVVLSPGPGLPEESGFLMETIAFFWGNTPILGVCLGMQAIGRYVGWDLINLHEVKHGVQEKCLIDKVAVLFEGLDKVQDIGLYHSWALSREFDQNQFHISACSENNVVMAIEHKTLPIYGVQFHPESILTPCGKEIIKNFLRNIKG
jgi:anthranilate synthase component 2